VEPSPFNDWRLVALSPFPGWVLAGLAAAAALAVYLAWRGMRVESRSTRRRVLLGMRVAGASLAVLLVLEPGVELLATTRIRGRVAVLVDRSRSMDLPSDAGGPTRAAVAASLLADAADRATLESRFQVEWFGFARNVAPLDPSASVPLGGVSGAAQETGPAMTGTDRTFVLPALEEVARSGGGRPLAGIVLVSDGADNGALDEAASAPAEKSPDAPDRLDAVKDRLKALGAPVFALDATGGALRDLALESVRVDDFAFVRNTVEIEANVSQRGLGPMRVPVVLEREGRVVVTREADVHEQGTASVKLPFSPDTTGESAFTVRVPVQEGEVATANNARAFVLKVIRDRVRVLHVAGRPSWDEKSLRMLLKRDPNVDLISFFILRTPGDLANATNDELSLIPFPTDEIFRQQLRTFDLVVFQNFTYRGYQMQGYLPGIAQYVKDGGAFLMLGGDNSFSDGGYAGSPLEDTLPVELEAHPAPTGDEPFQPRLGAAGRHHPAASLAQGEGANDAAWRALPPLPGLQRATLKPDAHALLEHPTMTDAAGRPAPVVAVRDVGRGRSMAILSDSTWLWSIAGSREGRPHRAYDDFFHSAIRWLVRDPELTHVRLQTEKERHSPSEPVAFLVQARTRDYGPAEGAHVELQIAEAGSGNVLRRLEGMTGADGSARLETEALPPGPMRVAATARTAAEELGRAEIALVVEEGGPEVSQPAPRPDLLKLVASATGGRTYRASDVKLASLPLRDPERVEIGQRRSRPIWDRLPVLLALCAVLGGEWFLRRRWGFF